MKCVYCGKETINQSVYCNDCIAKIFGKPPIINYSRPVSGGFTGASDNISIDKVIYKEDINETKNKITDFIKISILVGGDFWEKKYYEFISKDFPNYEKFWQAFVLPRRKINTIRLKSDVNKNDEYICMCNYTIFRKLISVKSKISKAMTQDVNPEEEIDTCVEGYFYLGSALDLVYKFLMAMGMKYTKNLIPSKLTEEKLVEKAIEYYRKRYDSAYKDYIENQKYVSMIIHDSEGFIKNIFAEYNTPHLKRPFTKLFKIRNLVIKYRNPFIHNPIIGNVEGKIPKKQYVKDFLNWSQIETVIDKPEIIKEKFTDIVSELKDDYNNTLFILNSIWGILINNLNLYSK